MTKLYKSTTDKVIEGVCGGLAEYYDIDSVIIRALFVLVTLIGGSGIVFYIVLAVIMPEKGTSAEKTSEVIQENTAKIEKKVKASADKIEATLTKKHSFNTGGVILTFLGIYFLLQTSNFPFFSIIKNILEDLWPLGLIVLGIYLATKKEN